MTKNWTLWELNPRPFTCARNGCEATECGVSITSTWRKRTAGGYSQIIPLDQAPDDVKLKVLQIYCTNTLGFEDMQELDVPGFDCGQNQLKSS